MNFAPGKCAATTALKALSVTTVWALAVSVAPDDPACGMLPTIDLRVNQVDMDF
jgi:hypothetical protein